MKLHLLFIFFLAAPLVARLLSSDASADADACNTSTPPAVETQTAPRVDEPATTKPVCAPAKEQHATTPAPASSHSAERRAGRARTVTFM